MRNKILSTLFFSLLIISCTPDTSAFRDLSPSDGGNGTGTGGGTGATGKLIASYVEKDLSNNSTDTFTFTYDGNILKNISNTNKTSYADFTYDSSNKLIGVTRLAAKETSVYTLQYTGTQLTKVNAVKTYNTDITMVDTDYSYSNGKLSSVNSKYYDAGAFSGSVISNYVFSSNNLSQYTIASKDENGNVLIGFNFNLSNYDTKKNPFSSFPKELIYTLANDGLQEYYILGLSANNCTKVTGDANTDITYTYDSDAYPKTMRTKDYEVTFTYK